jgi:hypothetical protein
MWLWWVFQPSALLFVSVGPKQPRVGSRHATADEGEVLASWATELFQPIQQADIKLKQARTAFFFPRG